MSTSRPSCATAGAAPSMVCDNRAFACSTSSSVATPVLRCRSLGALTERVGQREQDAVNLFRLLFLERDNLVVDFNGCERLNEQGGAAGGAAVDDARDAATVLCLDEDHVPAVPFGDHLLLQVLPRLLSAQIGLERTAQPAPLLPEAIADAAERSARLIHHLVRFRDRVPDTRDLAAERRDSFRDRRQPRVAASSAPHRAPAASRPTRETSPARAAVPVRAHGPSTPSSASSSSRSSGARSGKTGLILEISRRFRCRLQRLLDAARVDVRPHGAQRRRPRRRQRKAAHGVYDAIEFEGPEGTRVHSG